jgi:hypothetical protein
MKLSFVTSYYLQRSSVRSIPEATPFKGLEVIGQQLVPFKKDYCKRRKKTILMELKQEKQSTGCDGNYIPPDNEEVVPVEEQIKAIDQLPKEAVKIPTYKKTKLP